MQYVYENPNGPSYSLASFWENSGYTKTGVNVWTNCSDFYSTASTYGILTGTTSTFGPPGTCFNNFQHFGAGVSGTNAGLIREVQLGRNGAIFVGGLFTYYSGTPLSSQSNLVKLYNNGVRNTGFTHSVSSIINSIEIDPSDDKIYVAGTIGQYLRLNTNGSTDTTFNGGVSGVAPLSSIVYDIEQIEDGTNETLIGGNFTSYNSTSTVGIAQITTGGTLNTSFVSYFTTGTTFTTVRHISRFQSGTYQGKIVVGGFFTQYSGQSRNYINVLNSDGTLYTTFNPGTGFDSQVFQVMALPDGTFYCAGSFETYNGITTGGIVKLNIDGTINTGFTANIPDFSGVINPTGNTEIAYFELQSDGKIICFYRYSQSNPLLNVIKIIRLNADGSFDYSFNIGTLTNGNVAQGAAESIVVLGDDSIYVGGGFEFYTVGTETKEVWSLVKLDRDGNFINCG
jgi:uncharacterized delta-60 repeat protein